MYLLLLLNHQRQRRRRSLLLQLMMMTTMAWRLHLQQSLLLLRPQARLLQPPVITLSLRLPPRPPQTLKESLLPALLRRVVLALSQKPVALLLLRR